VKPRLSLAAEDDLAKATAYYDAQRLELGGRFSMRSRLAWRASRLFRTPGIRSAKTPGVTVCAAFLMV
jgi:hypothetical protein